MSLLKISQMIKKLDQLVEAELEVDEKVKKVEFKALPNNADAAIVLEIGHGPHPDGFEPGAVDARTGTQEWKMNKIVANQCYDRLKSLGYQDVLITDENDYLFSIGAKYAKADIFISIHHNAFSDGRAQGTETLVHSDCLPADRKLAKVINQQICEKLNTHDRGVKTMKLGVLSRSSYERNKDNKGVVLIEPYFITGSDVDDHQKWSKDAGEALATAIHLHLSGKARIN